MITAAVRRRWLLSLAANFFVALLAFSSLADHLSSRRDDWTMFDHRSFTVGKVIEGDTLQIRLADGQETIVHLIGVDAPDLLDPSTGQPAYWAEKARDYATARALNKTVTLRLEPIQTRDRYDRLLAYVYLGDNDCLNIDMIHDGEAYADRRFAHSYRPQYTAAENDARKKQRGLWKNVTEAQMPAWRRVWLHERDELQNWDQAH